MGYQTELEATCGWENLKGRYGLVEIDVDINIVIK
jgi:hypothetical protein